METVTGIGLDDCVWPECEHPRLAVEDAPPLCVRHVIHCALYASEHMNAGIIRPISTDEDLEHRVSRVKVRVEADVTTGVVYYLRINDHVKIGTTNDLPKRLQQLYLQPECVLATEPGGRSLEQMRHRQFRLERVFANRELFNPSPRLLAHIGSLKSV